jgi:hypothetical protein
VTDRLLATLEAVPAWQYGAARAVQEHRPAFADLSQLPGPIRDRLLLRWAELLCAAGDVTEAWSAAEKIDPLKLDADQRGRRAFLCRRIWVLAEGKGLPAVEWESDGSPLDTVREAVLRAEASPNHGAHPEAVPAWRDALMESARGRAAEELEYEASLRLGVLMVFQGRGAEAATHLKRAWALAKRYNANADEAGLSSHLYAALLMTRDIDTAITVAHRASALPVDVPGALPRGVVDMVKATEQARRGDQKATIEALDAALAAALERDDGAAYVTITSAKSRMFETTGRRYEGFKVLQRARAELNEHGHDKDAQTVDLLLAQLQKKAGPEEWGAWADRLKNEGE